MDTLFRLDRVLIRVAGPDTLGFLDNLLTQDVTRLPREGAQYAALLTPQGKVIADLILWAHGNDVTIECDRTRSDALMQRLNMYRLRSAVSIEPASPDLALGWSKTRFEGALPDPRLPELGWRGFISVHASPPDGAAAYEATRIAAGVPDLARDAQPEEVFAGEALLDELHGVDFQKGCFVGQENVSRMKRRATTRKKFCPLAFEGAPLPFGTPIRAGAVELGTARSSATGRALALLRLDRALEALANGQSLDAAGRPVRLDPPPWLLLPLPADAP